MISPLSLLPKFSWLQDRAYRLKAPSLLWIHDRVRTRDVLSDCAWIIPSEEEFSIVRRDESKPIYVDLYGSNFSSFHLGSGRSALIQGFHVKGVGRTSALSPSVEYEHCHGGASLEEGVREAIWSWLLIHELPYGANRVLAVIGTGGFTPWKQESGAVLHEARALIVREFACRPAHFYRQPYLSHSSKTPFEDGIRSQSAFNRLVIDSGLGVSVFAARYARRLGRQLAALESRRIFHGALAADNLQLNGAMLDFGSIGSLPDHRAVLGVKGCPVFGREIELLQQRMAEFTHYANKYASEKLDEARLKRVLRRAYERQWRKELLRLAGFHLLPKLLLRRYRDDLNVFTTCLQAALLLENSSYIGDTFEAMPHRAMPMPKCTADVFANYPSAVLSGDPLGVLACLTDVELSFRSMGVYREILLAWARYLEMMPSELAERLAAYAAFANAPLALCRPELKREIEGLFSSSSISDPEAIGAFIRNKVYASLRAFTCGNDKLPIKFDLSSQKLICVELVSGRSIALPLDPFLRFMS